MRPSNASLTQEALDRLPASVNPILFPNARGGRIDFRVFGRRHGRPAQIAAGIEPIRGHYGLRHTYATTLANLSPRPVPEKVIFDHVAPRPVPALVFPRCSLGGQLRR